MTTFNSGVGSSTLPFCIYGRIKFGITPEINAISTISVAITAIVLFTAWRLGAFRGGRHVLISEDRTCANVGRANRRPYPLRRRLLSIVHRVHRRRPSKPARTPLDDLIADSG